MNLTDIKQLLADEEAVSPVIGVILMVAITVILAAVIGTFVLGLGDNVQNEAPQANFQFQYSGDWDAGTGEVVITHNGGQNVDKSNVEVQVGSETLSDTDLDDWGDTISTGSSQTIVESDNTPIDPGEVDGSAVSSGDTIRIIWQSPAGGSSNTIGSSQIP